MWKWQFQFQDGIDKCTKPALLGRQSSQLCNYKNEQDIHLSSALSHEGSLQKYTVIFINFIVFRPQIISWWTSEILITGKEIRDRKCTDRYLQLSVTFGWGPTKITWHMIDQLHNRNMTVTQKRRGS